MKKFVMFLTSILPFLVAEMIQYIVVMSFAMFYSFYQRWSNNGLYLLEGNMIALPKEVLYLCSAAGILVCGIIFFLWYRMETFDEVRVGFRGLLDRKTMSLFVLLGVGCQFFFTGFMSLLTPFLVKIFSDYSKVLDNLVSGNSFVVLLLTIIIAPVTEELIFRGVILYRARQHVTFMGANLLQAILFGIYHGNLVQGIYAGILGFLLGVIMNKYKSIAAPIFLHIVINGSAFLTYLLPDGIISYAVIMIAGGIAAIIAIFGMKPLFGEEHS